MGENGDITIAMENIHRIGTCNVCHDKAETYVYVVFLVPDVRERGASFVVCRKHARELIDKMDKITRTQFGLPLQPQE